MVIQVLKKKQLRLFISFDDLFFLDDGQGTVIGFRKLGGDSSPLVEVRSGCRQAQSVAADTCPAATH